MLETMSADEYRYWQAYFTIEPFPEDRADRRAAEIMNILIQTGTRGKSRPKLSELVPDWWDDKHQQQTPVQIEQNMKLVAAARPKAFKAGKKGK